MCARCLFQLFLSAENCDSFFSGQLGRQCFLRRLFFPQARTAEGAHIAIDENALIQEVLVVRRAIVFAPQIYDYDQSKTGFFVNYSLGAIAVVGIL